jgi:hypothetical protein
MGTIEISGLSALDRTFCSLIGKSDLLRSDQRTSPGERGGLKY